MIKSQKESIIINAIALLSTGVSYAFTILMLMSFAETPTEKVLYFLCGVINDGVKWFTLITLIKYYKAKAYQQFIAYTALFSLFFAMSLIASISFSVFTVKKQMYEVRIVQNPAYEQAKKEEERTAQQLTDLEAEKKEELNRINTELDGLPLDYISRRNELSDNKVELMNNFDTKINTLNIELAQKQEAVAVAGEKETQVRELKNNAIAGFFTTISTALAIPADNVILTFSVFLGIILDVASIALTFDSAFSFTSRRAFNSDASKNRKLHLNSRTQNKILNIEDFKMAIKEMDLNKDELEFKHFEGLLPSSTFYKYKALVKNDLDEAGTV